MAEKMKVWPGPRIMAPMATDVLLVGEKDLPSSTNPNTGTPLSGTKLDYFDLFLRTKSGMVKQTPFNLLNRDQYLEVGAHLIWTLPYTYRRGHQSGENNEDVNFPLVPNRWLITRYEYKSRTDGSAPVVKTQIVVSNEISTGTFPASANQSQYPKKLEGGDLPVNTLGASVAWKDWEGDMLPEDQKIDLTAMGPGNTSWSVTYSNVRNVFGFHDGDLSEEASDQQPYSYTYAIIGWYADPEKDLLKKGHIPTDNKVTWQSTLESEFQWTVGPEDSDVDRALDAWATWQKQHGLDGSFDPDKIDLPPQAKAAIVAWHNWQQTNGVTEAQPNLAQQTLCQSMIATVEWRGTDQAYSSGNPYAGQNKYPSIAMAENAVGAISTYMANHIVYDSAIPQPPEDIPIIARALEAFQKDLLYDYGVDPIRVENLLHNAHFNTVQAGQEWIVVRKESEESKPSQEAGRQSIPLTPEQTEDLTTLNSLQFELNALYRTVSTQRDELFLLGFKNDRIAKNSSAFPESIKKKVAESTTAMTDSLTANLAAIETRKTEIATAKTTLETALSKTDFILKRIDLAAFAAPNDPVIMVAGAGLDTKFSPAVVDLDFALLDVRYTGQFIDSITVEYDFQTEKKAYTIANTELLDKVTFPKWKPMPKEVMNLWVETLILDISAAALIAVIYFEKRGIASSVYNAKSLDDGTTSPLQQLTAQIQYQQTAIWDNLQRNEYPSETALAEIGKMTGVAPAMAAVAFRTTQPWTPLYMDWSVKWFPTSLNSTNPFDKWELEEIDYSWNGESVPQGNALSLTGRSILNPSIAQNIQEKLSTFENDPNYDNLPYWLREDLRYAAGEINKIDILTQSVTGFTQWLATKVTAGSLHPDDTAGVAYSELLDNQQESYAPLLSQVNSSTDCTSLTEQQYAPIRSGHFQLLNVWVVDAFGQIMYGVQTPPNTNPIDAPPIDSVMWSESLTTPKTVSSASTYGQLAPKLAQPGKAKIELLKNDDDNILTNSSDETNPICGWVVPNHLDNALMVFDNRGENLGEIIKVQSENTKDSWSVRWDTAPGLDTQLGAPPNMPNTHLQGFVNGLLETGYEGALAYDEFMSAIDSALWTLSNYANQGANLSILLGRPLAVVRAQVVLNIYGNPVYQQDWCETGKYYNSDGSYDPQNPPYLSIPFSLRVGDAYLVENGIMGYFQEDDYSVFYPVYGANGQTRTIIDIIRAGETMNFVPPTSEGFLSSYVKAGHVVPLKPDGTPVKLTVLVDPHGNLPIFSGSMPYFSTSLPNGPVADALNNMKATFRAGPLLLDPTKIKMPTPAEAKGKWGWMERKSVTTWQEQEAIEPYTPLATLSKNPLRLTEGWLSLTDINKDQ